jgi:hypothetical protein
MRWCGIEPGDQGGLDGGCDDHFWSPELAPANPTMADGDGLCWVMKPEREEDDKGAWEIGKLTRNA